MPKPAARMSDLTTHGGVIVSGLQTVLIGRLPAARLGDFHTCPQTNPATPFNPHVGGPIVMGSAAVLIGGRPAARMGDIATCAGPPSRIMTGWPTVFIGEGAGAGGAGGGSGSQEAKMGAEVASKGKDKQGPKPDSPHWIEYQFQDSAGKPVYGASYIFTGTDGTESRGILAGDGRIRQDGIDPGSCRVRLFKVSNARWSPVKAKVGEEVELAADVQGIPTGTAAKFEIWVRDARRPDRLLATIEAQTQADRVDARWTYRYAEEPQGQKQGGYSFPEFYFIVDVDGTRSRSGLLQLTDYVDIELKDGEGNPVDGAEYILYLPNGEIRQGKLDKNGSKREDNIPPGRGQIVFPGYRFEAEEAGQ